MKTTPSGRTLGVKTGWITSSVPDLEHFPLAWHFSPWCGSKNFTCTHCNLSGWKPARSGDCTAKEAYKMLSSQKYSAPHNLWPKTSSSVPPHTITLLNRIWKHKILPRQVATAERAATFSKHIIDVCKACVQMESTWQASSFFIMILRKLFGLLQIHHHSEHISSPKNRMAYRKLYCYYGTWFGSKDFHLSMVPLESQEQLQIQQ